MKKLSRWLASALFTVALAEAFEWVQSVPAGERPRYAPRTPVAGNGPATTVDEWIEPEDFKPSAD